MISTVCQRWRDKRGTYRPVGETIVTADYEVAAIEDDVARRFIDRHHYLGSYPAARFRFGLYTEGELCGVAVFSHPVNDLTLACLPGEKMEKSELGRLVLLDEVPKNGESWFVARCAEQLRRDHDQLGAVMFSDPVERTDLSGRPFFKGHVGTIYQALNAVYLKRSDSGTLHLLPDGRVLHKRAIAKIRGREQGWRYSAKLLEDAGAPALGEEEDSCAWLARWMPRLCRPLKHAGNLKYALGFTKSAKRHLPPSLPFVKVVPRQLSLGC